MYNGSLEFQDTCSAMRKCGDDDLMNIFDSSSFDDNIEFEHKRTLWWWWWLK